MRKKQLFYRTIGDEPAKGSHLGVESAALANIAIAAALLGTFAAIGAIADWRGDLVGGLIYSLGMAGYVFVVVGWVPALATLPFTLLIYWLPAGIDQRTRRLIALGLAGGVAVSLVGAAWPGGPSLGALLVLVGLPLVFGMVARTPARP